MRLRDSSSKGTRCMGWMISGPVAPTPPSVPFHVLDAGDEEAVFALCETNLSIACSILLRMCMSAHRCVSPSQRENNVGTPPAPFGGPPGRRAQICVLFHLCGAW